MDIMKAILDIEEKAQSIMNTTDDIGEEMRRDTEKRIAEIDAGMKKDADEKISVHRANAEKKMKSELESLEKDFGKKLDALENAFAENRARWVKEITDNVKEG